MLKQLITVILLIGIVSNLYAEESKDSKEFQVPLNIVNDQNIDRVNEPVASGIPFAKGAVFNPAHISIIGPKGERIPCQAHQLGISWPDGSLKWALVQFKVDVKPKETAHYMLRIDKNNKPQKPVSEIKINDTEKYIEVSTGPMKFLIAKDKFTYRVTRGRKWDIVGPQIRNTEYTESFCLPNKVWVNENGNFSDEDLIIEEGAKIELVADREYMSEKDFKATGKKPGELKTFGLGDKGKVIWNKITRGINYSYCLTGKVNITVEEKGPLRAVIRIEKQGEKKEGEISFIARVYAYAGKKDLKIELSIINHEQMITIRAKPWNVGILNTKHIRRFTYSIKSAFYRPETVKFGAGNTEWIVSANKNSRLRQAKDNQYAVMAEGQKESVKGGRSPGWMSVQSGKNNVVLATKYFWESYPKGLAYNARNRTMIFEMWPDGTPEPGYPFAWGRGKTYQFMLGFDTPGKNISAMARHELRAYPDPEYVTSTGATNRFIPLSDKNFSLYASYVERTYNRNMRQRLYGDIDFGDEYGWNKNSRYNGYHDQAHEFFMFYFASGNPNYFQLAEAAVWHYMDVDSILWGRMSGAREAEFSRYQDHTCGGPIQGGIKSWLTGIIDYYFLTGDRRVLEILQKNRDFLMKCGGSSEGLVPSRATSIPFMMLTRLYEVMGSEKTVHELYPETYTGKYPFRTDSLNHEDSLATLKRIKKMSDYLSGVYDRKEYIKKSFMASYPPEGFYHFRELTGDKTAEKGVVKSADFLYQDLILPTAINFYATPEADGGRKKSRWQPFYEEIQAPAALAYQLTKDKKYLEYGKASLDWLLNYRGIAHYFNGYGAGIPTLLWAMREGGMSQDDITKMRPGIDYNNALKEIQDKSWTMITSIKPNTGESRAYCMLAEEGGRVLINLGKYDDALAWLEKWKGKRNFYDGYMFIRRAEKLKEALKDKNKKP